jgi:uroporphyrinogen-III synthase
LRILLTRPPAEALRSAEKLTAKGHHVIISPVLDMHASGAAWPSGAFDAIIATSAAAFELAQFAPEWPLPEARRLLRLFIVGAKTAEAARKAGFLGEISLAPDAKDLAATIIGAVHRPARLLYLAAHDRKRDLETRCNEAGLEILVLEIYEARAATAFNEEALLALTNGNIHSVLHYSRRSAEVFLDLARAAKINYKTLHHNTISADAAAPLKAAACHYVFVAAEPTEKAMLASLSA